MKKTVQCRMLALTIAFALAGAPTLALVGCGGGAATVDEAAVAKNDLTAQLESIKNLDAGAVSEMAASGDFSDLEQYGVSAEDFLKAFLANFDYSVGNVTVDGDTGTAEISLSMTDVGTTMVAWQEKVTEFVATDEAVKLMTEGGESALYQKLFQMLMDDLASPEATIKTGTYTFDISKSTGKWDVTDAQAVTDAMLDVANMQDLV